jgi:hypothetical protein
VRERSGHSLRQVSRRARPRRDSDSATSRGTTGYAPAPRPVINALDFDGPEAVAAYMRELAADPARYSQKFDSEI